MFLARFSRPEALRVGSTIIEHHIVTCWTGWVVGFVRPRFKIWFRILEVLNKNLVLSESSEISAGNCTIPRPGFSAFSTRIAKFSNFNMHATNQYFDLMRLSYFTLMRTFITQFIQFIQFRTGSLWRGTSKCARNNAILPRRCYPFKACSHYQGWETPSKQQAYISGW